VVTTTVDAIYENGILRLSSPLPLPDKARVVVTISNDIALREDSERTAWLKLSEEKLTRAWDNTDDDVFNALLET